MRLLADFVRIPSVSAQPALAPEVGRCARWLAGRMAEAGLEHVRLVPTRRHPLVLGDWLHAPGRPVVLVYGHYDVAPAGPLEDWTTPPFEPARRGSRLCGRGTSDDKGPLLTHVIALGAALRATHRLPVNVRCLFDGEEEIGSPSLAPFLSEASARLAADVAVLSDTAMPALDRPAITVGLRGSLRATVEARGPSRALHAGAYGGIVHSPAAALASILARLHHADGRVAVPGFYDDITRVRAPASSTSTARSRERALLSATGVPRLWGEPGFEVRERRTRRPSITVTRISSGPPTPGSDSRIPARARATIDVRLVPRQDPRAIARRLARWIARVTPPTVRASVHCSSSSWPVSIDSDHPAIDAAIHALERGFGVTPELRRSGGSIPAVGILERVLGIPCVLMGYALPEDRPHGPDESFDLRCLERGVAANIAFLESLATM